MTITISNLTVAQNAPAGTTVGVLTTINASGKFIPCNFILKQGGVNFAISSKEPLIYSPFLSSL